MTLRLVFGGNLVSGYVGDRPYNYDLSGSVAEIMCKNSQAETYFKKYEDKIINPSENVSKLLGWPLFTLLGYTPSKEVEFCSLRWTPAR